MDEEPLVSVVRGTPTPEELAALLCALASRFVPEDSRSRGPALASWPRSARPAAVRPSWRASGQPR
ncbi:acyl-CoA carboxylase subunit epsilon [Actinoplanes sp. ATCC 53533]|uniref:acyl-CoA carboxylase epsilon subunit n=1 Tax=Actinoplanes sp. ATCC 53533 TaxID=1288362 RepID=UPI000F7AFE9D|nr:acyl-CoA carboxylase epsilon subunit [Actinoplanes sp. ATCC 53533]RSM65176.1 acyl-CoA carboxylase subunit epsilon [Actinoplanes sp. ATCC 53533]